MIRVLICDDQVIVCEGLQAILSTARDIEVVGVANDGAEAVEMIPETQPDIVLMDLKMPVMNGIQATRLIRDQHPGVRVLILTTYDADEWVFDAIRESYSRADDLLLGDLRAGRAEPALADFDAAVQGLGQGAALDDGYAMQRRQLADAHGQVVGTLGHDLRGAHHGRVVLQGHGEVRRVGHDHVGLGDRLAQALHGQLARHARAALTDQRIAFHALHLVAHLLACHA